MTEGLDQPWAFYGYPSDTASDVFGPFQSIVELWKSKQGTSGEFPEWGDFDFYDFEGWWGQISLTEVSRDPIDLFYVLWGTKLTEWWGIDYTKKFLGTASVTGNTWDQAEREYFSNIVEDRCIGFLTGSLERHARGYIYVRGIDLPLEQDGIVTHILTAFEKYDPADAFTPHLIPTFRIGYTPTSQVS